MSILNKKSPWSNVSNLYDGTLDGTTTTAQVATIANLCTNLSFALLLRNPSGFSATVTVWASNLVEPDATADADWTNISADLTVPTIVTVGVDTNYLVQIEQAFGNALHYRIKVVRSAGTSDVAVIGVTKKFQ